MSLSVKLAEIFAIEVMKFSMNWEVAYFREATRIPSQHKKSMKKAKSSLEQKMH